jgi:enoyl-CoA hydratase/carnithine racemase
MNDERSALIYEVRNNAAWLTINREPRRNAISPEVIELFFTHLETARTDDAVRAVCITGAGDVAFCSGADLSAGSESGPQRYADLLKHLAAYPKPIVGRLNGDCLAGGLGLMLSCDIVYARRGIAIRTPEVRVGLFPMMIGALILRNATRKSALEMIYTARKYSADEAREMGMITRVHPAEELDAEVERTLSEIAANGPAAIRIGRRAFAEAEKMDLETALDYLCAQLGEVMKTEDAMEGITAFFEKRPPVFKNR